MGTGDGVVEIPEEAYYGSRQQMAWEVKEM